MNLVEFIALLRNANAANEKFTKQFPGIEIDQVDVYVRSRLDFDSEIVLFDAEKIPNEIEIEFEGAKYINLFPCTWCAR